MRLSRKNSAHCNRPRSEEHTSELQSRPHLVCRLLLEKKKNWLRRKILMALMYRNADLVVTITYTLKKELIDQFGVARRTVRVMRNSFSIVYMATLAS